MADEYEYSDASESTNVCKVYDGDDGFTVFVQFLLCAIALASLWIKRLREVPRRKFLTWFLDVSKQAVGAAYAHVLNMIIANVIAQNVRGDFVLEDECAWYAINYLFDTSFGLVLSIMFLRLLDRVANDRDWTSLKNSGVYHGKEAFEHWLCQILAWMGILTVCKIIVFTVMWAMSGLLAVWGSFLFGPFQSNIRFELLFVMIFFPGFLNIIWFWITDSYLKAASHHAHAHEPHETDGQDSKAAALLSKSSSKDSVCITESEEEYVSPVLCSCTKPQHGESQPQQEADERPTGEMA